tara:strand:+ start:234 stop:746 length:513 start_codon:yes stop_codon:yes gene_type:complete
MKTNLKLFPWFILPVGFIIYLGSVLHNRPADAEIMGGLILMLTLSLWVCLNIAMGFFNIKHFIRVFSIALYIFAITVFFLHGVEEVSYPEGAVIFHFGQIVKALALMFLGSLPLLYFYNTNVAYNQSIVPAVKNTNISGSEDPSTDLYLDSQWEPATQEDLDAGEWEIDY